MNISSLKIPIVAFNLLAVILLYSCQNDKGHNVIEKEILINVLTDLHITDALLATKSLYDGKLNDSTKSYYNFILKKYNISRADFDYSLDYYSSMPEEYLLIYDEIIENVKTKIPKKLHANSIYRIFEMALRDAEIMSDLNSYYGVSGRELWLGRRAVKLPNDTASFSIAFEKEVKYQCLLVFTFEIKMDSENNSKKLEAELELSYNDSSKVVETAAIDVNQKKDWQAIKIVLKTDSLKKPKAVKAKLFNGAINENIPMVDIRKLSLRQYAPDKDTNKLYIVPGAPNMNLR